ncbi:MAG: hypothetical protein JWM10_2724 [Myxococcaceae bacterium]|nr:hypothetical protein [Myxococcaceae bacterium]
MKTRTPVPSDRTATSTPDFDDSIDRTRKASAVDAAALPACPPAWRSTSPEERGRRLRHLSEDHRAEALDAGEELIHLADHYAADFGALVPDPAKIAWVLDELRRTLGAAHQIERLRAFHAERAEILTHDLFTVLSEVHREFEHRVDRVPVLAERYRQLPLLFAAIRRDISDGIAAANARREAAAAKG